MVKKLSRSFGEMGVDDNMNKETLKKMLLAAASGQGYQDFSIGEVDTAVQSALKEFLNISDERSMRRLSASDFGIIEEVIEITTPRAVEDIIGQFAEVRTFDRNEQVIFNIRNVGKARVMKAIVPGARAGIYRARRLDNAQMDMVTEVETVGYALSLEDLLTGRVTIKDYVQIVTQGFIEVIYQRMMDAFVTAAATAPEANRATATSIETPAEISKGLDKVLRIVSAYGTPTIFTFASIAGSIANILPGSFPDNAYVGQDAVDIRSQGYVSVYKGRQVVVLPNFLTDNSNAKWLYAEDTIYVLPANEKPVKVAFAGDLYIQEVAIPSGGVEYHAHREVGVGLLTNHSVGSVKLG